MGTRKISLLQGEYYHIYNRGNSKQQIFFDEEDYVRFCKLLYLCNSEKNINFRTDIIEKKIEAWDFERGDTLVSIGAWVLMPNHFHIYLIVSSISPSSGNNIASFMRKLCTAYSKYINAKYNRTGSLFEGKFKAVHIESDEQAKYLFSYIHLNPIKLIQPDWRDVGIKDKKTALDFLMKYTRSSYMDFKHVQRFENKILNTTDFPPYFENITDFDKEILDWITIKE